MDKREFKDKVFSELAKISQALGNAKRLEIVDLLAQGEKTVDKIAASTGMSVANTSQHLQVLKAGNLVSIQRKGNFISYKLSCTDVAIIYTLLRDFGTSRIAEIDKVVKEFRAGKHNLDSVTVEELIDKMSLENVVLLDVRPQDEFESGHISGALSIPIEQLAERLSEIPSDKTVVAYCRGPFCVFADEAVKLLHQHNFNVTRLEEGFPDWKMKGLPIETTTQTK
jgi:rhodanese-related sulfurtransferase/DNA-binding transcriptional ArsR family regulator